MTSQLRSLCVIVVAGLMLSSAQGALGQPVVDLPVYEVVSPPPPAPPPPPTPPNERTLIVDISSGRGLEPQFMNELGRHLRRSGVTIVDGGTPDPTRTCETPVCLEDLARRDNIGMLISARIAETAGGSYTVTMALYDAVRRTSLKETAECLQCNQMLLSYKINDLADKLISQCRDARPATSTSGQVATQVPSSSTPRPPAEQSVFSGTNPQNKGAVAPVPRGYFAQLSTRRKVLASFLGGLAGAVLISSVALTVTNGKDTALACDQRMDVLQDKCILKNTPLFVPGYVLTGALVVGIGFTLFWPKHRSRPAAAATATPTQASASEVR